MFHEEYHTHSSTGSDKYPLFSGVRVIFDFAHSTFPHFLSHHLVSEVSEPVTVGYGMSRNGRASAPRYTEAPYWINSPLIFSYLDVIKANKGG